MANYRNVHVKIWSDEKFQELKASEKLIFLYLITNNHLSTSGLYPLTYKTIAFETDLPMETVLVCMNRLIEVGMILYDDENMVVWVKNLLRYQPRTPNNLKSVLNDLTFNEKSFLVNELVKGYQTLWGGLVNPPISYKHKNKDLSLKKEEGECEGKEQVGQKCPTKKPAVKRGPPEDVGDVKKAIDYFSDSFQAHFGSRPMIVAGKDGAIMRGLVKSHGLEGVFRLVDDFLTDESPFVVSSARSIGVLQSQVNRYIANRGRAPTKPTIPKQVQGVAKWLEKEEAKDAGPGQKSICGTYGEPVPCF